MSTLITGGESFVASGTILPATFVKLDTAIGKDNQVLACGVGDQPYAVSQNYANAPTIDGLAVPPAATISQPVLGYVRGVECLLTIGVGGCIAGDLLKPDINGAGVTTILTGDKYGAIARRAGLAGDKILVKVDPGVIR